MNSIYHTAHENKLKSGWSHFPTLYRISSSNSIFFCTSMSTSNCI